MSEEQPVKKDTPTTPAQAVKPAAGASTQPPRHVGIEIAAADEYKAYMVRLKSGGYSTISESFGSALDLLCDSSEPELPPRIDVTNLQPQDRGAMERRMLYLTHLLREHTRGFLTNYCVSCRNGEFGAQAKKSVGTLSSELFGQGIKVFTCAATFLTTVEQVNARSSPDWLTEFFAGSLAAIDMLVYGVPAHAVLRKFNTASISDVSRTATTDLCYFFGFGEIGNSSWDAAYSYLRNSGKSRAELFHAALTKPIEIIENELDL